MMPFSANKLQVYPLYPHAAWRAANTSKRIAPPSNAVSMEWRGGTDGSTPELTVSVCTAPSVTLVDAVSCQASPASPTHVPQDSLCFVPLLYPDARIRLLVYFSDYSFFRCIFEVFISRKTYFGGSLMASSNCWLIKIQICV